MTYVINHPQHRFKGEEAMTVAQIRRRQLRDASRTAVRLPSAVAFGSLEDGMMVCLGLLRSDPERFEPVAVAWHARWSAARPGVSFAESHAMLSALEALTGPNSAAAAHELSAACRRCQLDELAAIFDAWLDRNSEVDSALKLHAPPEGPAAA